MDSARDIQGDILHLIIACRQETQQVIEGERQPRGRHRVSEWRKCIDRIIGLLKKDFTDEYGIDHEFVVYHITTRDRLATILKEGLKPNSVPNWFESKTPYIMLSKYPYWQLYEGEDMILLEIKHPDILTEFFNDPEGLRWGETILPQYIKAVIDFKVIK